MRIITLLAVSSDSFDDVPYNVDFETLRRVQGMTEDIVGIILGLLSALIVMGLFLITVVDVAYIVLPPLQSYAHGKNWDGSMYDGKKFRLISRDAIVAVQEGFVGGQSSLLIYLKKRIKSYIIAAIVLFIIISGSQTIVSIVVYLMSGLLDLMNIL